MRASSRWSEFRARGGLWVLAQFALMGAIAASWFLPPAWPELLQLPFRIAGASLVLIGIGLVAWAQRALGRAFTPYTHPPADAARVEDGPYRFARHPMYGGGILVFAGASLAFSVAGLVLTGALATLWVAKSRVEEGVLLRRFPAYDDYRRRTKRRFLPGVY